VPVSSEAEYFFPTPFAFPGWPSANGPPFDRVIATCDREFGRPASDKMKNIKLRSHSECVKQENGKVL
jgi:hypothetical protein